MTAPITPDERAAMRARYPAGPIHESDLLAMGMRALDDVPRLLDALDALDTAEQFPDSGPDSFEGSFISTPCNAHADE